MNLLYLKYSLSIDIGSYNIKIIYGGNYFGKIKIGDYGYVETPKGSFKNGYIKNVDLICDAINGFIKIKNIKPRYVSFALHSKDIISRNLSIPVLKGKNLEAMIRWEMNEYTNGSINDYYLSYEIVEKCKNIYKILTIIIPKRIVDGYIKLANRLGLELRFIDVASKCLLRVFKGSGDSIAAIDFGSNSMRMSIFDKDKLYIDKEFSYDINDLTVDFINKDEKNLRNIKFSEEKIDNYFNQFRQIIDFYIYNNMKETIDKIYFVGGGSMSTEYTGKAMEHFLSYPWREEFINNRYKGFEGDFKENISIYINCLGLLMRKG